jgi:hypothetical protein
MSRVLRVVAASAILLTWLPEAAAPAAAQSALPKPDKDTVLRAADIKEKLFPEAVFFRGQSAPVEMRNTGGVHFTDDYYVLAGMVDNSGYSTGIREKYQAYLLSEVTLEMGGKALKPGAYGIGFLEGGEFVVMDLAANDVLVTASGRDAEMKRPVPLQIVATAAAYRLYIGRDFVDFRRTK